MKKNNLIVVRPNYGLANRMRVINSCLVLNNFKKNIKIVWEKTNDLNCDFNEIFVPIDGINFVSDSKEINYFSNYKPDNSPTIKGRLSKLFYLYRNRIFNFYSDKMIEAIRYNDDYWLGRKGRLIIDTCHDFFDSSSNANYNFFNRFIPIESLQFKINELKKKMIHRTIGVHIRRSDNQHSIASSKTYCFIKRMNEMIDNDSNLLFYLSTDDFETESYIRSIFESKIITNENKVLNRDTKEGIQDALVDLYALSNTSHILGSYFSSYSFVASQINKIPFEIVKC